MVSGRGIGMGAVLARVRQFQGEITVASRRGEGTCWRLVFPLTSLRPHESAETRDLHPPLSAAGG